MSAQRPDPGTESHHPRVEDAAQLAGLLDPLPLDFVPADEEPLLAENGGAKVGHGSGGMILLRAAQ